MTVYSPNRENLQLSKLDARMLLAFAQGSMSAYQAARQSEIDAGDGSSISNGAVYPAVKRLVAMRLIEKVSVETRRGNQVDLYALTGVGRVVLEWEAKSWTRLAELAAQRQQKRPRKP